MRLALPFAICFAAVALVAQSARPDDRPVRLHGTVGQFDGNSMTLKADSGKSVLIGVGPETRIVHSRTMSLAEIRTGDFVASLSLRDATGKLRALGLHVFQNSVEQTDEGQYSMPSDPARIVIDGTVSAVSAPDGKLSLSFHGAATADGGVCTGRAVSGDGGCTGSADLVVARGVPIVALSSGDATLLRAGAIVSVVGTTNASNALVASTVIVERDTSLAQ